MWCSPGLSTGGRTRSAERTAGRGRQARPADRLLRSDEPLPEFVERLQINEIVIGPEDRRGSLPMDDLLQCRQAGIAVTSLATFFERELGTIALCWRIERRDGVTIGLTAHDRDLVIDGLVYRAAPGMTPSAVSRSASLDADSMDVTGALTSSAISEKDLLAGRWDGARVYLFATDWQAPAASVSLGEGVIGAVETRGDALTAELRGIAAALERPVPDIGERGNADEIGGGARADHQGVLHAELRAKRLLKARNVLAHGKAAGFDHPSHRGELLGAPRAAREVVEHYLPHISRITPEMRSASG